MTAEVNKNKKNILWFSQIGSKDIALVGGKNASLGEMYNALGKKGISIPNGFALTAKSYRFFLEKNNLQEFLKKELKNLDTSDVKKLAAAGKKIRSRILKSKLPKELEKETIAAFKELSKKKKGKFSVAVRSSATAEDLPEASFAGQQESFLHITTQKALLDAVRECYASLFTDRAISYRQQYGFEHMEVALSVTVQEMIDGSAGCSGVMFTLDTESGFEGVTLVTSSYGLGEYIVKGKVVPDQFYIFKEGLKQGKKSIISRTLGSKESKLIFDKGNGTKHAQVKQSDRNTFSLSEKDVLELAKMGNTIEAHYGKAQDIEWVKEGKTGKLYIVQSRPETVKSRVNPCIIETYSLNNKSKILLEGIAVGQKIGTGKVKIIDSPKKLSEFKEGDVLVTKITDPDWEPIMKKAAAIVTEQGGKTSHAAIVSRELGVPCIVGAKKARKVLKNNQKVTVSSAEGEKGYIYEGLLPFEVKRTEVKNIPKSKTKIMMNVGNPENAFSLAALPSDGVGLARLEFIFSNFIRIHPLALVNYNKLKDKKAKKQITEMTVGYKNKTEYCTEKLAEGVGKIAAAFYPKPVIVRLSDFKSNEYSQLIGGKEFEPEEENPMIGFRGASRYYSEEYKDGFALECAALKRVRDDWGLTNVVAMVPFCRTPEEGEKVLKTMKEFGLERGKNGLEVFVMCEIPSNVILADDFAKMFDGFSIGSNDLTQLTLGLDRDTSSLAHIGDANDPAVKHLIKDVIKVAKKHKRKIGICGQAPSDYPEFAEFLVDLGIQSISLNPDTLIQTRKRIAKYEKVGSKKKKKTNKKYLSVVGLFALASTMLINVGAGCSLFGAELFSPEPEIQYVETISPAEMRAELEKKVRKEMEEKQKLEEEMKKKELKTSTLYETGFASFSLKYPADWIVLNGNEQIEISDVFPRTATSSYIKVYKIDKNYSIVENADKEKYQEKNLQISGRDAKKVDNYEKKTEKGDEITLIEVEMDAGELLVIELRGQDLELLLKDHFLFHELL